MAHHEIEGTARYVADSMYNGDARTAVNTLREEANNMNSREFRSLINRTSQLDPKGDGVDLEIVNQPTGRDSCGRIINDQIVGVAKYDRDGDRHFFPVANLGSLDRRASCSGDQYYRTPPFMPVPQPGIDPRYDRRFQPPVPMYDPHMRDRPIFRGYPTPHRGGGITISPAPGFRIDIPLGN